MMGSLEKGLKLHNRASQTLLIGYELDKILEAYCKNNMPEDGENVFDGQNDESGFFDDEVDETHSKINQFEEQDNDVNGMLEQKESELSLGFDINQQDVGVYETPLTWLNMPADKIPVISEQENYHLMLDNVEVDASGREAPLSQRAAPSEITFTDKWFRESNDLEPQPIVGLFSTSSNATPPKSLVDLNDASQKDYLGLGDAVDANVKEQLKYTFRAVTVLSTSGSITTEESGKNRDGSPELDFHPTVDPLDSALRNVTQNEFIADLANYTSEDHLGLGDAVDTSVRELLQKLFLSNDDTEQMEVENCQSTVDLVSQGLAQSSNGNFPHETDSTSGLLLDEQMQDRSEIRVEHNETTSIRLCGGSDTKRNKIVTDTGAELATKLVDQVSAFQNGSFRKFVNYVEEEFDRQAETMKAKYEQRTFSGQDFLKDFEDPIAYYYNVFRPVTNNYKEHVWVYLQNQFPLVYKRELRVVLKRTNFHLTPAIRVFELVYGGTKDFASHPSLKSKVRKSSPVAMPTEANGDFYQELIYLQLENYIKASKQAAADRRAKLIGQVDQDQLTICKYCSEIFLPQEVVMCRTGHKFCFQCVCQNTTNSIANTTGCLSKDCQEEISLDSLQSQIHPIAYATFEVRRQKWDSADVAGTLARFSFLLRLQTDQDTRVLQEVFSDENEPVTTEVTSNNTLAPSGIVKAPKRRLPQELAERAAKQAKVF